MIANRNEIGRPIISPVKPGSTTAWHLWKVIFPRRSITGRLVWGTVWRRNDGRRWTYKKFVEYSGDE